MDDRWMRALLRPLDLLAFLSMTPVPSDARTWIGYNVLDSPMRDE